MASAGEQRGEADGTDPAQPVEPEREEHHRGDAGGARPRDAQEPGGQDPRPHRTDVGKAAAGAVRQRRGEHEAHEDRERLVAGSVDHPLETRRERVAEVGEHRPVAFDFGRRRRARARRRSRRSRARPPRGRAARRPTVPRTGRSRRVAPSPIRRAPAPTRRRRAPTTGRRSAGSLRSRAWRRRATRPPTRPITIGFARRLAAQIPTTANRKYPKRSGRRCPPTVSRPNGAITSSAAAAYATTVRCRHNRTTRAIAPASMMAATTFCTKSTRRSDGVCPTTTRRISPASPRRTKPDR